jgi:hypothetical protein
VTAYGSPQKPSQGEVSSQEIQRMLGRVVGVVVADHAGAAPDAHITTVISAASSERHCGSVECIVSFA